VLWAGYFFFGAAIIFMARSSKLLIDDKDKTCGHNMPAHYIWDKGNYHGIV